MNIIPLMVSAGLPFTNISVDRGEDFDANVVKSLIDGAASHLVILTPGGSSTLIFFVIQQQQNFVDSYNV